MVLFRAHRSYLTLLEKLASVPKVIEVRLMSMEYTHAKYLPKKTQKESFWKNLDE